MAKQPLNPLLTELVHWQDVTRLRYNQFLGSLTALEMGDASRHLNQFARLLNSITEFCNGRLNHVVEPDNESFSLGQADYQILSKTLDLVKSVFEEMEQCGNANKSGLRTVLVDQLDIVVRMRNIMVNHQQRQQQVLFPLLSDSLEPLEQQMLADELTNKMLRAQPVVTEPSQVEPN